MQFDSLTFVLFFALVLAGAAATRGWSARKSMLLLASYLFYAAWNPWFVLLLAGGSMLDWMLANRIAAARDGRRRAWLVASLVSNLGVLGLFKYGAFVQQNLDAALALFGVELATRSEWSLVLPVGISFYVFQSLSYTIDVYRRQSPPIASLRDYCLFVAFFPQLVAGPIVRFAEFAPQLQAARAPRWSTMGPGLALLLWGLFEKIVLADGIFAPVANAAFASTPGDAASAWVGVAAFAGQIFCDFAGYSCCAIGAARCLGFELPRNFRNPYAALGFADFWRRWHISLSRWLRDYLYIPLGGNRGGRLRTYRNLMLTMLLGGLWHGASWNFVLWGAVHGAALAIERMLRDAPGLDAANARGWMAEAVLLLTLAVVVVAWIPFRAADLPQTLAYVQALWRAPAGVLSIEQWLALGGFATMVFTQRIVRDRPWPDLLERLPAPMTGLLLGLLLCAVVLSPGETHAFIYFQF